MGTAFYAEAQIYEWARNPELVIFALNWSDRPDLVCHELLPDCPIEHPHLMIQCNRFDWTGTMGWEQRRRERQETLMKTEAVKQARELLEAAESLWNCVANAGGGNWNNETEEWQKAATNAREQYFSILNRLIRPDS